MAIDHHHVSEPSVSDALDPFHTVTRALLADPGLERTLDLVVTGALAALPAVSRAGVTMLERDGSVASHAPSDPVVATLDALQDDLGEGPCHDCVHTRARVTADDLALVGPPRWPRFAPVALEHQIAAMCSVHLATRQGFSAALNLYAPTPGAFDEACLATAALVASHAAIAIGSAHRVADLTDAIASRDVIGQAKGILMERKGIDGREAFDMLVRSSQDTNIKLRDVAAWLVAETVQRRSPRPERSGHR